MTDDHSSTPTDDASDVGGPPEPSSPVAEVAHVGLTVPHLGRALEMWCDGLGFTLERTFTLDEEVTAGTTGVTSATIHAATVTLGHHRVELLEYEPGRAPVAQVPPSQPGATHVALTVTDLDAVLAVCRRHGWVPVGEPYRMTSGPRAGTDIVYLHGATGGTLELIAPPRSEDGARRVPDEGRSGPAN